MASARTVREDRRLADQVPYDPPAVSAALHWLTDSQQRDVGMGLFPSKIAVVVTHVDGAKPNELAGRITVDPDPAGAAPDAQGMSS